MRLKDLENVRLKDLENWLTPYEAGQRLGLTRQGVHIRLNKGELTAVKTHQGWLIDPESVPDAVREARRRTLQEK